MKVSPSRLRKPSTTDYSRICCKLIEASEKAEGKQIVYGCDPQITARKIVLGTSASVIIDEAFLLVYAVGKPWYDNRVMVEERLVLRIGEGSDFSVVTDVLDDLADDANAALIVVGSELSSASKALARMYKRQGFVDTESPTLVKRR